MNQDHPDPVVERKSRSGEAARITEREREVLLLVAEGLTDEEVARQLFVSISTVRTHLVHLREKLQVRNRVALVRAAHRLGLIPAGRERSTFLSIGGEARSGYTEEQEFQVPSPSVAGEDAGGRDPAGDSGPGEAEMLTRPLSSSGLAALVAASAPAASAPAVPLETRLVIRQVWANAGAIDVGGVSPDGQYLSYVDWSTGDLRIRELSTGRTENLTNKGSWAVSGEFGEASIVSPDGRHVAYTWFTGSGYELRAVGLDGSHPRTLSRSPEIPHLQPAAWSPDGKQILAILSRNDRTHEIAWIGVPDGAVRTLKRLGWRYPGKLCLAPDGSTIAYDLRSPVDPARNDLYLLAADGSTEALVAAHPENDAALGWAPDSRSLLFASNRTGTIDAWILPVRAGKQHGAPIRVKRDLGRVWPIGISQSGAFYYARSADMIDVYTARLEIATGKLLAPPTPVTPYFVGTNTSPTWSPDGQILSYLSDRGSQRMREHTRTICIQSVRTGAIRELPPRLNYVNWPRWSPDAKWLVATGRDRKGRRGLFRIDATSGNATPIVYDGPDRFAKSPVWSVDGRAILYEDRKRPAGPGIVVRNLSTGRESLLLTGTANETALSPDGRHLAVSTVDHATGSSVVTIVPVVGGGARELIRIQDAGGISTIAWSADGRQILFGRGSGNGGELWRAPLEGGEPKRLGLAMPGLRTLQVHPDGRRIAFTAGLPDVEVWVMEAFLPSAANAPAPTAQR